MLWSMHIKQGAISSLMLMFLGEVSSVFFNPWLAARDYKKISGGKSMVRSLTSRTDDNRPFIPPI